jgi:hypothetical protein
MRRKTCTSVVLGDAAGPLNDLGLGLTRPLGLYQRTDSSLCRRSLRRFSGDCLRGTPLRALLSPHMRSSLASEVTS